MLTKKIQLLVTSDVHGYMMPTTYRGCNESVGLALLAKLITKQRSKLPTLLIDNGDLIQGSPLTYFKQHYRRNEPSPIIDAVNQLQYDAAIFGNHEFNYGIDHLNEIIAQSTFPWICCNIELEDGTQWVKPYEVFHIDGIAIGVIGVTTHFITTWEAAENIRGLKVLDAFESAKKWLTIMQQNEDIQISVICYHGGFSHALDTGELEEQDSGENQGYQMLEHLPFDILVTGHQHREISTKAFGKSVIQPGYRGSQLGKITIEATKLENGKWEISHEPELLPIPEFESLEQLDQKVVQAVQQMHLETEQWLDEPIATVEGNLRYEDAFHARVHKHPYIQFLQQVQMEASGAPISCTSLFHDLPGGFNPTVTMRDIVTNYIYPNTLKVLSVQGKHLILALEQCASYFSIENGKLVTSQSFIYPKAQPYNYDMWEGIDYTMDISKPIGQRITNCSFQGEAIKEDAHYEVVMNNYRATGAGNFPYFATSEVVKDIQEDMTEILATYLRKHPVIHASCTPNWSIVY